MPHACLTRRSWNDDERRGFRDGIRDASGTAARRQRTRPVIVSLESAVPHTHFYRHLEHTLDLSFVRDLVADRYAEAGRPSVDPVVFLKLHLVMFFEGIRSERKLIEMASLNLAHRWYLGYTTSMRHCPTIPH